MIRAIHTYQIGEHGGALGLRDKGLLDSALDRPRNKFAYDPGADSDFSAAYGFGIARNHPFIDGNKRAAFQAMYVFLGLNGIQIDIEEPEVVRTILSLASGDISEAELASWIRLHTIPRSG
jgi:death-on-curing protein